MVQRVKRKASGWTRVEASAITGMGAKAPRGQRLIRRHVDEKQDHNGSGADKHFESYGAYICPDEIEVTAKECNENGSVLHRGLNAEGWAHLFCEGRSISAGMRSPGSCK